MIRTTVIAKVRPEKRKEFLDSMRSLQDERTDGGKGHLRTCQDVEDPNTFSLVDEWETDEDLAHYLAGEGFKVFLGALTTLCMDGETKVGVLCEDGCKMAEILSLSTKVGEES